MPTKLWKGTGSKVGKANEDIVAYTATYPVAGFTDITGSTLVGFQATGRAAAPPTQPQWTRTDLTASFSTCQSQVFSQVGTGVGTSDALTSTVIGVGAAGSLFF